jgi:phytoene dehydrogenase-like protein
VFPDGSMLGVEADPDATERNVADLSPGDVEAWRALRAKLDQWMPHVGALMGSDLPSLSAVRAMARARRALGTAGMLEMGRLALISNRAFTEEHFTDPRVRALVAAWGMHLDFAPDLAGGALFSFLETFGGERFGMVIAKGGAEALVRALVAVITEHGGEVRCGQEVVEVSTLEGRASGVVLSDGSTLQADAVVANVNPTLLPGLLRKSPQPLEHGGSVRRFRPGLATMMIHLALSDLPPWQSEDARRFNYVHVGGLLDDMALAYTQAAAGRLPERPVLVVGQPTVSDPSRAPDGKHVLWVQVRVLPNQAPDGQSWEQVAPAYADHVMELLEEHAPGLSDLVLDRAVLSPDDLERHNRNLVGGDSLGGSHHPAQYFFLRPAPGWTRHRTPVKGLYLCGAGTWPGAGVGGGSGAMVADLLAPPRRSIPGVSALRNRLGRPSR